MAAAAQGVRRGGRGLLILLVVLVVLGAAVVVADRVVHRVVEQRVAAQLQTSLRTPAPPQVTIAGTPFLTQAAANHFDRIDVGADGVTADNGLVLRRLDAHLYDVRTADRYRRITADRLDGTVDLDYSAVSTLSPVPLRYAGLDASGRGRVQADVSTEVFGQTLGLTLSGVLGVDEAAQTFTVTDPGVEVAGVTIPSGVVATLAERFLPPLPVGQLPLGVRLVSVQAAEGGLTAQLGGTDVVISGG